MTLKSDAPIEIADRFISFMVCNPCYDRRRNLTSRQRDEAVKEMRQYTTHKIVPMRQTTNDP